MLKKRCQNRENGTVDISCRHKILQFSCRLRNVKKKKKIQNCVIRLCLMKGHDVLSVPNRQQTVLLAPPPRSDWNNSCWFFGISLKCVLLFISFFFGVLTAGDAGADFQLCERLGLVVKVWQAVQRHRTLAHGHVTGPGHRVNRRSSDRQLVVRRGVVRAVCVRLPRQTRNERSINFVCNVS